MENALHAVGTYSWVVYCGVTVIGGPTGEELMPQSPPREYAVELYSERLLQRIISGNSWQHNVFQNRGSVAAGLRCWPIVVNGYIVNDDCRWTVDTRS